jgi:type I site-specific restriction-modification system R (restriction) subunit
LRTSLWKWLRNSKKTLNPWEHTRDSWAGVLKFTIEDGPVKTIKDVHEKINQLIEDSLISDDIIDVLAKIGIERPEPSILTDEFLDQIKASKRKNVAIELLKRPIIAASRS